MAAAAPATPASPSGTATEIHHEIPRCLLKLHDAAFKPRAGEDAWLTFALEATRYGIAVTVSREDLVALVEASTVLVARYEHRVVHGGDFVRWGRRGGLETLRRYGRPWFSLLALKRWGRVRAEVLKATLTELQDQAA